jgi:hypothetical protein
MTLKVQTTLKSRVKKFPQGIGYLSIKTGVSQIRVAITQEMYPFLGRPFHSELFEDTYFAIERGFERIINKLNASTKLTHEGGARISKNP